jgi:hypothetical protein
MHVASDMQFWKCIYINTASWPIQFWCKHGRIHEKALQKKWLSIILYRKETFCIIYEELALSVWSWDMFLTWDNRDSLGIKLKFQKCYKLLHFVFGSVNSFLPIPVAAPSQTWIWRHSLAAIAGSNRAGGMKVCLFLYCPLSGKGLCDGSITRPEESCRVWCVWVWSRNLNNEDA